jgi:hypothetical protein
MTDQLAVVFGSGASFDSGFKIKIGNSGLIINPPIDQSFFHSMPREWIDDNYHALSRFKQLYFANDEDPRMEEIWTAVNLNHKHIRLATYPWAEENHDYILTKNPDYANMDLISALQYISQSGGGYLYSPLYSAYKFLGDCDRDFRRLVFDIFSNYLEPEKINNYQVLHSQLKGSSKCTLMGYISFNYDCFLEHSITPAFKYVGTNDNPWDLDLLLHREIPIVKLHGSLNWQEIVNPRLITYHAPPYIKENQVKPRYVDDANWSQPAMIPPTIFKQEVNDDARSGDVLTQAILQQWRAALRLLIEADRIIIVGYSFPPTDYHTSRIFRLARMRRVVERKPPVHVLYCGGEDEKPDILSRIFGKEVEIIIQNKFSDLCSSKELSDFLNR